MVDKLLEIDRNSVLKKFNKSEEDVYWDVKHIRDWLTKQAHLPNTLSERRLEFVLLQNKWSLEKTKQSLEIYYAIKNQFPVVFDNWDPLSPELQSTFKVCGWLPLEKLTKDHCRVNILRLLDNNPDSFNQWEVVKMMILIGEIRSNYDYNYGEHLVFDLRRFQLTHLKYITPSFLKKVHVLTRQAYRLRLHGIHLLHLPPRLVNLILSILKSILKPKLYEKVHIHPNTSTLYEKIPQEILPVDYGGIHPPFKLCFSKWVRELENSREWLMNESKLRVDDSKRIEIDGRFCKNYGNISGSIDGSFRKLQID